MYLNTTEIAASDTDLERRVINFLKAKQIPGVRWIEVESTAGILTMTGTVRSFYQKQLCTHCARRVAGVIEVIDEIDVA
jgi:osmotically-inducible protein OsmY